MSRVVRINGTQQIQVFSGVVTGVGAPGPPGPSGQIADTWSQAFMDNTMELLADTWTDVLFATIVTDTVWNLAGPDMFDAKATGTYVLSAIIQLPAGTGARRLRIVRLEPDGTPVTMSQDEIIATTEASAVSTTLTARINSDVTIKVQAFADEATTITAGTFVWSRIGTGPKGDPGEEGGLDLTLADGRYLNITGDLSEGPLVIQRPAGTPVIWAAEWFTGADIDGRGFVPIGTPISEWKAKLSDIFTAKQANAALHPAATFGGVQFSSGQSLVTDEMPSYGSSHAFFFVARFSSTDEQFCFMWGNDAVDLLFAVGRSAAGEPKVIWNTKGTVITTVGSNTLELDTDYVFAVLISPVTGDMQLWVDGIRCANMHEAGDTNIGNAAWWIGANPLSPTFDGVIFDIAHMPVWPASEAATIAFMNGLANGHKMLSNYLTVNNPASTMPLLYANADGVFVSMEPTVNTQVATKGYVDSNTGVTGIPTGGGIWDVIGKNSATNFDVKWRTFQIGPAASAPGSLPDGSIYLGY